MRKLLKEPLVHFLFGGFLLFIYFKACSKGGDNLFGNSFSVNKERIVNYIQFQSKAFNREVFENRFYEYSEDEKQQIIENYIRDEVLYREAVKLGLDQNDFVIKRRIIQKMEFLLDDFDETEITLSEDSIQDYYFKYSERYFQPQQFTFTHIYFKENGNQNALERAISFMKIEQHQRLTVEGCLPYGDRFLYHRNYAEKDKSFLGSQFGKNFVRALEDMDANTTEWQGPVSSEHGQHWIKLIDKSEGKLPELQEIYPVVKSDYLGYLKQKHKRRKIEQLINEYTINIDL